MSGISSRLNNDSCSIAQYTKTSCAPADYSLFLDYHVNPNLKSAKDIPCASSAKTIGCAPCNENANAVIEIGPHTFVQLADIEDNLRGTKRNLTKCANSLYASCELAPNAPGRIQGECNNSVIVNPRLCERSIVPTNLKFPVSKGF